MLKQRKINLHLDRDSLFSFEFVLCFNFVLIVCRCVHPLLELFAKNKYRTKQQKQSDSSFTCVYLKKSHSEQL